MKNIGLKYGLIGGILVALYFGILYISNKPLFLDWKMQWLSMVIYLVCMYKAATEDCAQKGISRDFRDILRTPFVVFLLINLVYWLFYYTLHLADPELSKLETAMQLKDLKDRLNAGLGDPQQANQIREQMQYLEREGTTIPLGPVFMRMAMGAIGGFGLSAGIAAMKKN